jgi:hypothetical protein
VQSSRWPGWSFPHICVTLLGIAAGFLVARIAYSAGVVLALPIAWAWAPGASFGSIVGVWGAVVGTLVPRGRGRAAIMCSGTTLLAAAALMLGLGLALLSLGCRYAEWYPWTLSGGVGLLVMLPLVPMTTASYRRIEARRLQAMDLASLPGQGSIDER